jgi:hypothetical protein
MRTLTRALVTLLTVVVPGAAAPGLAAGPQPGPRMAVFQGYYRPT